MFGFRMQKIVLHPKEAKGWEHWTVCSIGFGAGNGYGVVFLRIPALTDSHHGL